MKILTCVKPGQFEYSDGPVPLLEKDCAIIKIKRIGICGTDLHAFEGTQPFFTYPRILGHELSGELVAIDGQSDFTIGEAVTFIPYFNCGTCIACRSFKPNCCSTIKVCGVHIDGGMVEYLQVPSYSLVKGQGLSFDELALVEPLAIGAHSVRRAHIQPGEFVLVVGAGPIGLGVMDFARISGAKVIAMDINLQRLEFCQEKIKVDHVINAATEDVYEVLKKITDDDFPSVVIDATGSQRAINNGFQYLAHGGRYVLVGLQKNEISFSHPEFHKRELTLLSSRNATRADFDHVIAAMKKGDIDPKNYITNRAHFEHIKEHFDQWLNPQSGVVKVMTSI